MKHTADKRLSEAAELISQGAVLADIGTDHAKLPVSLILSGKIDFAYLCDINEGPLSAAAELVREAGVEDKVKLVLTDGLRNLPLKEITDISICGMGGELISQILQNSLCREYSRISFILNPMSRDEALRRYFAEKGFVVKKEIAAVQSGRVYSVMNAVYTGVPYEKDDWWYYIGEIPDTEIGVLYIKKVLSKLYKMEKNPSTSKKTAKIIKDIEEKIK